MASHKIRVRMRQKNADQFQSVLCQVIDVTANIPFRIDYDCLTFRCDKVRRVREPRDEKSLDVHRTTLGSDCQKFTPRRKRAKARIGGDTSKYVSTDIDLQDQSGSRSRLELFLEGYDRVPDRVERGLQSGSVIFGKRVGRQTNLKRLGNALKFLDELAGLPLFDFWRPDHLCRRLGRTAQARTSYQRALELARQEPERRFLERRLRELPVQ